MDVSSKLGTNIFLILQFDRLADSLKFYFNVFKMEYSKIVSSEIPVYLSENITV
jgi:hypothetical protein